MVWPAARGAVSTTSRPTSGRRSWPTTSRCSSACVRADAPLSRAQRSSNWHSPALPHAQFSDGGSSHVFPRPAQVLRQSKTREHYPHLITQPNAKLSKHSAKNSRLWTGTSLLSDKGGAGDGLCLAVASIDYLDLAD